MLQGFCVFVLNLIKVINFLIANHLFKIIFSPHSNFPKLFRIKKCCLIISVGNPHPETLRIKYMTLE